MVEFSEQAKNIVAMTRATLGDAIADTVAKLYCMGRCDGGLHVVKALPDIDGALSELQALKQDFDARMTKGDYR